MDNPSQSISHGRPPSSPWMTMIIVWSTAILEPIDREFMPDRLGASWHTSIVCDMITVDHQMAPVNRGR